MWRRDWAYWFISTPPPHPQAAEEAEMALTAILGQDLGLNTRPRRVEVPIIQKGKLRPRDT